MMTTSQIRTALEKLNDELLFLDVKGEVCLYGGAVMCLVYDARPNTKDVDAVFKPTQQMREAAKRVAGQWYGPALFSSRTRRLVQLLSTFD